MNSILNTQNKMTLLLVQVFYFVIIFMPVIPPGNEDANNHSEDIIQTLQRRGTNMQFLLIKLKYAVSIKIITQMFLQMNLSPLQNIFTKFYPHFIINTNLMIYLHIILQIKQTTEFGWKHYDQWNATNIKHIPTLKNITKFFQFSLLLYYTSSTLSIHFLSYMYVFILHGYRNLKE
ncbi:unnamed protein product (macronuclear) [Paramecium tetraurelia]|uniref:Uncharacterized protein n=1 Tax=Paramecium tetraurelia TaxID=5888 RepID=A0DRN9_PARTE|nr:uncharacterized protein GSPATT00019424001 [Paramecium tetraurelia]CAK85706.1 unnamed protein product [Paramecium tetraurelia]|eukprot:XP_001453103.1 hypothetical protein (macronuclear) [Paramecium tetraurelia strain d4-2]